MSVARNHHYVPQMLLRRFANASGRLHVFDGKERKSFEASPKDVATIRDFYQIDSRADPLLIESDLSKLAGC